MGRAHIFIAILIATLFSCKKQETLPIITTLRPCLITDVSASCGGVVYDDGKSKVTERGLCFSEVNGKPSITDHKIICNGEGSNFTGDLVDLKPKTKYYIRSYAMSSEGVAYGGLQEMITFEFSPYPSVVTATNTSVGLNSALCGGSLIFTNVASITEYGICYSKSNQLPLITDSKLICQSSSSFFTGQLVNLDPNTVYYFRAYATNKDGTGYGAVLMFKTYSGMVADIEGNIYFTVKIGGQEWMAQNLNTSKYRDGTDIGEVQGNTNWTSNNTGAWCNYNDDVLTGNVYGKLYNWYAVNNSRGLAPAGWHVASQAEWLTLLNYCNSDISQAGRKLSEQGSSHWQNGGGSNDFSFAALPGGVRGSEGFYYLTQLYSFWTSSSTNTNFAPMYSYGGEAPTISDLEKYYGCSVRCIKD
jgi:uncharacterized protein (TIGR02145 family)